MALDAVHVNVHKSRTDDGAFDVDSCGAGRRIDDARLHRDNPIAVNDQAAATDYAIRQDKVGACQQDHRFSSAPNSGKTCSLVPSSGSGTMAPASGWNN